MRACGPSCWFLLRLDVSVALSILGRHIVLSETKVFQAWRSRPLSVAFVDVKKALDSVSHQTILIAGARLGVPPPFLVYLRELYSDARTRLRIGTELSDPIKLGRGVRPGDPMSVHFFNAVIDLSLADLGPGIGTTVE